MKQILIASLLSGLVGSLLGIGASFGIYFLSRWQNAKDALRGRLLELRPVLMCHAGEPIDFAQRYERSFYDIWQLVATYRQTLPWFLRRGIEDAWHQYKGGQSEIGGACYVPPTSQEATHRVEALLKAISYPCA